MALVWIPLAVLGWLSCLGMKCAYVELKSAGGATLEFYLPGWRCCCDYCGGARRRKGR